MTSPCRHPLPGIIARRRSQTLRKSYGIAKRKPTRMAQSPAWAIGSPGIPCGSRACPARPMRQDPGRRPVPKRRSPAQSHICTIRHLMPWGIPRVIACVIAWAIPGRTPGKMFGGARPLGRTRRETCPGLRRQRFASADKVELAWCRCSPGRSLTKVAQHRSGTSAKRPPGSATVIARRCRRSCPYARQRRSRPHAPSEDIAHA